MEEQRQPKPGDVTETARPCRPIPTRLRVRGISATEDQQHGSDWKALERSRRPQVPAPSPGCRKLPLPRHREPGPSRGDPRPHREPGPSGGDPRPHREPGPSMGVPRLQAEQEVSVCVSPSPWREVGGLFPEEPTLVRRPRGVAHPHLRARKATGPRPLRGWRGQSPPRPGQSP